MAKRYAVAKRKFIEGVENLRDAGKLTPEQSFQAEFVRLAFDQYGYNKNTRLEPVAKKNLTEQLAKFEAML